MSAETVRSHAGMKAEQKKYMMHEYLYSLQKRRRLIPVYIFLTKEGLWLLVEAYVLFSVFHAGTFGLLMFLLSFYLVWKFRFPYFYHERRHLWLCRKFNAFLQYSDYSFGIEPLDIKEIVEQELE